MGTKITKIGITNKKISARGGLSLFLRYVEKTGFYGIGSGIMFSKILKSNKGLQLQAFVKQILAFFMDGTHGVISGFDQIKGGGEYAALLECRKDHLASSHQIKRYFTMLSCITNLIFNKILHELFLWRLSVTQPQVIVLGADTMLLDNDRANKREGNEVMGSFSYRRTLQKRKCPFQSWDRLY